MLILGIESSCDDTAVAVVEDGERILSSIVSTQDDIHVKYGGIVPELASRRHIEMVIPVVERALKEAGVEMSDIGAIGVTKGPGLVGSLLIGLSFAKALSYSLNIPYVGVNHLEAHPLAAFLKDANGDGTDGAENEPGFPFIALLVSGGHTALMKFDSFTDFTLLGQTRDDAAGEAFDKVSKLLGLGFPGGAVIDARAKEGNPKKISFTRSYLSKGSLEFSFSGLKTAVRNVVFGLDHKPTEEEINDICAGFQEAAVDVLVRKVEWAVEETGVSSVVAAGGVACNSRLRERLKTMADERGLKLSIPKPALCSDNGAMIALNAFHLLDKGERGTLEMNAMPNWGPDGLY
jgi:N6-L-threonylcarbamoyladenine synthase